MTDTSQEGVVAPEANEGEGTEQVETVAVPKKDYDALNQTLGSLKRELKDLKNKTKEEPKETPQTKPDEHGLLQKSYLRAAQIVAEDEVELALTTAKKWGVEIDKVVDDEDFKVKLEKLRTSKSNALATSGLKGGQGTSQAKNTPEYWLAKGVPPSRDEVPDRKTRATIARAFMKNAGTKGKTFYND